MSRSRNGLSSESTCFTRKRALLPGVALLFFILAAPGLDAADVPFADGAPIADQIMEFEHFATADVDGDGTVDVLAAGKYYDEIAWWRNTIGDGGTWEKSTISDSFNGANSVHTGDVDGDGDLDVLGSAYFADDIAWWENTVGNGSAWIEHTVVGNFDCVRNIHSVDVDGDGDLDVLGAAGYPNHRIAWWENTDLDGVISWTYHNISYFDNAYFVVGADVDGDGDVDVIGSSLAYSGIAWWENTAGDGSTWSMRSIDGSFEQATRPHPADVDGDGDLDVLGAAQVEADVTWWENTAGDGRTWTKHTIDGTNGLWVWVRAADLDVDGDLDILGTEWYGNDVTWFENIPGNEISWTEHTINDGSGFYSRGVLAADLDRDADLDMVGGSSAGIVWWENLLYEDGTFWQEEFSAFDPAPYYILGTTGSAVEDGDSFLITQNALNQAGRIFLTDRHYMDGFQASFNLYLGNLDGADGTAFLWCPTYDYSQNTGSTLDASCTDGFLVGFDTHEVGAPDLVYVAHDSTVVDNRIEWAEVPDLENNAWHEVTVTLIDSMVTVHLDGVAIISDATIDGYVPFGGFFGFSAATGALRNEHRVDDIIVQAYPFSSGPVAAFSWEPEPPFFWEQTLFVDQSRYNPTGWEWDFDNDGECDSTEQFPTYLFGVEGIYPVTLRVQNDYGVDEITRIVHVPPRLIPLADFSWAPLTPTVGEQVTFSDESTFDPTSWAWDFDNDGQTDSSDREPPIQVFSYPGTHPVRLTATNNYGSHSTSIDIEVLPDPYDPPEPYVSSVTPQYDPGYFLQSMDVTNTFAVGVNWQGFPQGWVRFSTDSGTWCEGPDQSGFFHHSFNMASDFQPSLSGSLVTITPCQDPSCDLDAGQSRVEPVYVFPYPTWLDSVLGAMGLDLDIKDYEVIASIGADFPDPHLAEQCSPDNDYDGCNTFPEWVPLLGEDPDAAPDVPSGVFDLVETYARFEGSVSTFGSGSLSLYGQTGFCAMDGCVMGSIGGAGEFDIGIASGLVITQTSFNLHLEGVLSKSVTLSDIPQVASVTSVPIIGPVIKEITDRATLSGQIAPYLDLSASWAQNVDGDLVFAHGEGTLGLDLKAMLALDLGVLNLSAWVAGGGSFTLGLPEDPLIRAAEVHAQLGLEASLSYTFKIFWKTFTLSLAERATLDIGCDYVYDRPDPWGCYAELELMKMADRLLNEAGAVRVIEHDYERFGEYAVFRGTPVARTKSAKVPVAVAKTKIVENLFPGASPAIAEAGPDMLLVYVHDDINDPDLQSTEIAWSSGVWDTSEPPQLVWSAPVWIADDTRAEFDPVLGITPDGEVVAAWLRIKDENFSATIEEIKDLPLFYTRLDVVSAVFDPIEPGWGEVEVISLLDDQSMDTDLKLAGDAAGNLMLTWLSNEEGHFFPVINPDDPADPPPSYVNYSFWGAEGFNTPQRLPVELWGVSSHASAISGDRAVVLVPRDPDLFTIGDEVIELYEWNGSDWSGPTPFASGAAGSRAPSVVFDDTGEGQVVWLQGDDLVKATLSDPVPTVLRAGSASLAFLDAKLINNPGGNITLTWQETVDNQPADIFAMIYDPNTDTWSEDRRLTDKTDLDHPDSLVHQASAIYDSESLLHAAYVITEINRVEVDFSIDGQDWPEQMNNIPEEGQTNLTVMTHKLIDDLAVEDHDLFVEPIPDDSDDRLRATLTVHNAGFFPTDIPDVDLYLGDPDADGESIGALSAVDPPVWFAAGGTIDFTLDFDPPSVPGNLVVVVDGSNAISEEWEDNNKATWYRENHAPVAVARIADGYSTSVWALTKVEFDGSSSFDQDGDEITMRWAFADGSSGVTGSRVCHEFIVLDTYPVTLSVTDRHGAVGTAVVEINVVNPMAPVLVSFDTSVNESRISGTGKQPKIAVRRLGMFLDLLMAASDFFAAGDEAGALGALTEAVDRSDGRKPPLDYIDGEDCEELNLMLETIVTGISTYCPPEPL